MREIKFPGIYIGFLVLCITVLAYLNFTASKRLKGYEMKGVVDRITYDVKGLPYVDVNGTQYYLGGPWNFEHKIEEGDSIIKRKGDMSIKLIKKNTGEIIQFR